MAAVSYYQPATNIINAVSNWWGTTNLSVIEQNIYHRPDNPSTSPQVDYSQYLAVNPNFTPYGVQHFLFWFSPNGDGVRDNVTIQGALTHASAWSVLIVDSSGSVVRTLLPGNGMTISNVWDGTLQGGELAPEGRYRSVIAATNSSDARAATTYGGLSYSDRTAPLASESVNPLPDGTIANQLTIRGTAGGDLTYTGYTVDYGIGLESNILYPYHDQLWISRQRNSRFTGFTQPQQWNLYGSSPHV